MADEIEAVGPTKVEGVNSTLEGLGKRILAAADNVELRPEGALWLWEEEPQQWRFYLVTSLLEEKGPLWVYRKMLQAFSKVDFPKEVDKLSLRLCSPREPAIVHLMPFFLDGTLSEKHLEVIGPMTINGMKYERFLITRLMPPRSTQETREVARRFEHRVEELLAA